MDSELFDVLKKHSNVKLELPKNENSNYMILRGRGGYLNLQFRFTGYEQRAVSGEELNESMLFCVDDLVNDNIVYPKE